ncbi:hypothetical protein [Saccharothrix obliqua]|uniref:hypothetical protein n=1 Tax=Saccharothrix obliqua TaxID=2861747 RepID=UPI001C603725|nr:hypothetical protein [Saccharothrix obliqua]MBW4715824.1 hypothetical protein [Saccharothrix obliqua]
MRTLGKLVASTAAALVITAPVANAAPAIGGLPNLATNGGGPLSLVQPVTQIAKPLLGQILGG